MKIKISERATHARNELLLLQNVSARVWQNLAAAVVGSNQLIEEIIRNHCHERSPVVKDQFYIKGPVLKDQYHQIPPVLRDQCSERIFLERPVLSERTCLERPPVLTEQSLI